MSVIWNQIYTDQLDRVFQVGGFFVSPLMSNGSSYDLNSDILSNPPSLAVGDFSDAFTYCRVCSQVVTEPDGAQVFKGFPPRKDYGILTIGVNPAYILERRFINYPFQFHGIYNPTIGVTYPDVPEQKPIEPQPASASRIYVLSRTEHGLPQAGSVFSLYSDYPDLELRVRGALMIYPITDTVAAYLPVNYNL